MAPLVPPKGNLWRDRSVYLLYIVRNESNQLSIVSQPDINKQPAR